jgi:hypothetical protein
VQTFKKLFQLQKSEEAQRLFKQAAAQAQAFEIQFAGELSALDLQIIQQVMRLPQLGLWRQRFLFRRLTR